MHTIETERLQLRPLTHQDASFILTLVNDPDWLEHIGDKQVHNLADAVGYLEAGPMQSYRVFGFGLLCVTLKSHHPSLENTPIGLCGLLQRQELPAPDLGYALLPEFRGKGYIKEACFAIIDQVFSKLGRTELLAIVSPENEDSIGVLTALGFKFVGRQNLSVGESNVYQLNPERKS